MIGWKIGITDTIIKLFIDKKVRILINSPKPIEWLPDLNDKAIVSYYSKGCICQVFRMKAKYACFNYRTNKRIDEFNLNTLLKQHLRKLSFWSIHHVLRFEPETVWLDARRLQLRHAVQHKEESCRRDRYRNNLDKIAHPYNETRIFSQIYFFEWIQAWRKFVFFARKISFNEFQSWMPVLFY